MSPPKKKVTPEHWQVVPVQEGDPITLCVTVRDRFGAPLASYPLHLSQSGKPLQTPEKADPVTDADGRAIVAALNGRTLGFTPDPGYVSPDPDAKGTATKNYVYSLLAMTTPRSAQLVPASDGSTSDVKTFLDTTNAYVTIFCDVTPWTPAFRFPWLNPVHLAGADPIYKNRVASLTDIVKLFGEKSPPSTAPDLVQKLIDLFNADTLFGGKTAPPPTPPAPPASSPPAAGPASSPTGASTAAVPTAPSSSPQIDDAPASVPDPHPLQPAPDPVPDPGPDHPPNADPPTNVTVQATEITPSTPVQAAAPVTPAPAASTPAPAATPPATAPPAASGPPGPPRVRPVPNPNALPAWAWYMIFHYSGLRYSAASRKVQTGAHGTYANPSLLLKLLRQDEIDARFPDPKAKGAKPATPPDVKDATEAFVFVAGPEAGELADIRGKNVDNYAAALAGSDAAKATSSLRQLWQNVAKKGQKLTEGRTDSANPLLNGDHYAIGFLKARHIVKPFPDADWKAIGSYTPLKCDAAADGWEVPDQTISAFSEAVRKGLNAECYDGWKARHLVTLDHVFNSAVCNQLSEMGEHSRSSSDPPGAIPPNATAASRLAPLMLLSAGNVSRIQRGMHLFFTKWGPFKLGEQRYAGPDIAAEAWLFKRDKGVAASDAQPPANIKALDPKFTLAVLTKGPALDGQDKIDGLWCVDLELFWSETQKGGNANQKGSAWVQISAKGTAVEVLKFQHQEIIIDVDQKNSIVRTYSTAANAGLGVRTYTLTNLQPGNAAALVGFIHANEGDGTDPRFNVFLNTTTLAGK